jgi:hypothetical protein
MRCAQTFQPVEATGNMLRRLRRRMSLPHFLHARGDV